MSVTPGPVAMPSSIANGRAAAVPGSNTVSMWPMSRTRGAPVGPWSVPIDRRRRVDRPGPAAVRRRRRSAPGSPRRTRRPRRRPRACTSRSRCRPDGAGRRGRPAGPPRSRPAASRGCRPGRGWSIGLPCWTAVYRGPARPVGRRAVASRILPGPCVWSRSACSRARTSTGSSRWSSSRSPSAVGARWYGQRDPGRHALVWLGATVPARDWPDPIAAVAAWIRRLRQTHGEGRSGLAVHRSSDPGHWIVTFPWVGEERARLLTEAALALAERDVSPSRTAQLTGGQARLLARWTERLADAPGPPRRPGSATPTGGSRSSRSRAPTASRPSPG